MESLNKEIPLIGFSLIIFGISYSIGYYMFFSITITDYLDPTELLTQFSPTILLVFILVGIFSRVILWGNLDSAYENSKRKKLSVDNKIVFAKVPFRQNVDKPSIINYKILVLSLAYVLVVYDFDNTWWELELAIMLIIPALIYGIFYYMVRKHGFENPLNLYFSIICALIFLYMVGIHNALRLVDSNNRPPTKLIFKDGTIVNSSPTFFL